MRTKFTSKKHGIFFQFLHKVTAHDDSNVGKSHLVLRINSLNSFFSYLSSCKQDGRRYAF